MRLKDKKKTGAKKKKRHKKKWKKIGKCITKILHSFKKNYLLQRRSTKKKWKNWKSKEKF